MTFIAVTHRGKPGWVCTEKIVTVLEVPVWDPDGRPTRTPEAKATIFFDSFAGSREGLPVDETVTEIMNMIAEAMKHS